MLVEERSHTRSLSLAAAGDHRPKSTQQLLSEAQQEEDRRLDRLMQHLAREQSFVEDVDAFLRTREHSQLRRKQALHREWDEKVPPKPPSC